MDEEWNLDTGFCPLCGSNLTSAGIRDDDRPIMKLAFPGDEGSYHMVGACGLTRIVAYSENGQGASVPWFALYRGDALIGRINAAHIEGVYYIE